MSPIPTLPTDQIIGDLVITCRARRQIIQARTRLSNQIDAQERLITGKLKHKKEAKNAFVVSPQARAAAEQTRPILAVHLKAIEKDQKPYDKAIAELTERLPVWRWAKDIKGVGPIMLGLIIGETGDLSQYPNPAKVWKRLGLAVMPDGKRQRKVSDAEEAIAHGYNPQRRAIVYMLGQCLVMLNGDGPYRKLFEERKALELERLPVDAKGRKAWAQNRASRYVQKRFLVHLWEQWRRPLMQ